MKNKLISKSNNILCLYIILYIFIIVINFNSFISKRKRNNTSNNISFINVPSDMVENTNNDSDYKQIRINVDWSLYNENLQGVNQNFAKVVRSEIIPRTMNIFQKLVKVRQFKRNLVLDKNITKCDRYNIPQHLYQKGFEGELLIFPILEDSGEFIKVDAEAAAVYCIQSNYDNRPVVGFIEYNPTLKADSEIDIDYHIWLSIHELVHVFVFNDALFPYFIDPLTLKPLGKENVMKTYNINGNDLNFIITKNVRKKAEEHFNCQNAKGIPLENKGDEGSKDGHWHRKAMGPEFMISKSYGENLISEITLALFEDSGWYKVNYNQANGFFWGKGAGCDFLYCKECFSKNEINLSNNLIKVETKYSKEFCSGFNAQVCSSHHMFRGSCKVKEDLIMDKHLIQIPFSDPKFGGLEETIDHCPIAIEEKQGQEYYGGSCRLGRVNKEVPFDKICPNCTCIVADISKDSIYYRKKKKLRINKNNKLSVKLKSMLKNKKNKNINNIGNSLYSFNLTNKMIKKNRLKNIKIRNEAGNFKIYDKSLVNIKAACVEYKCENNNFYVFIDNIKIDCTKDTIVKVNNIGTINCPNKEIVCGPKYDCKFGCIEKYSDKKISKFTQNSNVINTYN